MRHLSAVKTLLEDGRYCSLSAIKDGRTALHNAAFIGHNDIVEFLIPKLGQDTIDSCRIFISLNQRTGKRRPSVFVGRLLIEKGAAMVSTVPGAQVTPLHIAVYNGLEEIALLLTRAGADVNAEDTEGVTPLHLAVSSFMPGIDETLLDHGGLRDLVALFKILGEIAAGLGEVMSRVCIKGPDSPRHRLLLQLLFEVYQNVEMTVDLLRTFWDKTPEGIAFRGQYRVKAERHIAHREEIRVAYAECVRIARVWCRLRDAVPDDTTDEIPSREDEVAWLRYKFLDDEIESDLASSFKSAIQAWLELIEGDIPSLFKPIT